MDGIVIGSESEQVDTKDFNKKIEHILTDGKIISIPEENIESQTIFQANDLSIKEFDKHRFFSIKNTDSIAFVLFASNLQDNKRIGITYDFQPSLNKSVLKAFTCQIPFDSSIEELNDYDLRYAVIEQVIQQCGFKPELDHIKYFNKSLVSDNASEYCHLFGVSVDKTKQISKTTKDPLKINSGLYWAEATEVVNLEDWKSQLIVIKAYSNKNTIKINKS